MVGNREIVYFCKRAWYFMILVFKIWKEKRFAFELHCTWYMLWFVEWCTSVTRIGTKLYCMKQLPAILDLTNHLVNTDGQKVCFRDNIRWIRVSEFGYYHSKNSHSESDTRRTVNLLKSRTRAATDSVQLPVRTVNKVALKRCKVMISGNSCTLFLQFARTSISRLFHSKHLRLLVKFTMMVIMLDTEEDGDDTISDGNVAEV